MRSRGFYRSLTGMAMLLALPVLVFAQGESSLSGTVTDTTGGALPGVTVVALHEATGNTFETVTGATGTYRLAVRVGVYLVTAELAGFGSAAQSLTLLLNQDAVVDLEMGVEGVAETVTVTGEAPLLDLTESSLGGNIDARQMTELPINGRNWMELIALAPGARVNAIDYAPVAVGGTSSRGDFQLNVDGQQVTQLMTYTAGGSQPRFSRDAIGEFEFVSSRFDATQGRSVGIQVNAVTKAGTNTPSGTFSGYFRDDSMNAADKVVNRVLPYSNQQVAVTLGGPLLRDKIHFFAHYEYERQPTTVSYTTPYPHFNADLTDTRIEPKGGVRMDAQFTPQIRLAVRGSMFRLDDNLPSRGSGTRGAMSAAGRDRVQDFYLATLTQVFSNRAVNEIKGGYSKINYDSVPLANPSRFFTGTGGPVIAFKGLSLGGGADNSRGLPDQEQTNFTIRNDFTLTYNKGGRHTLKMGGEFIRMLGHNEGLGNGNGNLDARGGPIPDNLASLFPDIWAANTWNLDALSAQTINWRQTIDKTGQYQVFLPRHIIAGWVQDDWTVSPRLTVNLGVRYDLEENAFANDYALPPFVPGDRPEDTNNIGPRVGFSFSANENTVIRGGAGVYFGSVTSGYFTVTPAQQLGFSVKNDGRADFASNPFNGPTPKYAELRDTVICTPELKPGCFSQAAFIAGTYNTTSRMPYSWQPSIGIERQIGNDMSIEADYVYVGTRDNVTGQDPNTNLTYNRETGANYSFFDRSRRVHPEWGLFLMRLSDSYSNLHTLQTGFTKRMSNGWQASGSYTMSALRDAYARAREADVLVPFPVARDLGGEYTLGVTDQRHRATFNGIWQMPAGFQLSGLYFFGSGERYETRWGVDIRKMGGTGESRLRPDGTIVDRNSFTGEALHRVDMRLLRRFPLGGRVSIDGMVEVFNLFNHGNYGSYAGISAAGTTSIVTLTGGLVSSNFGNPVQNPNVAFGPRTAQLGFRLVF